MGAQAILLVLVVRVASSIPRRATPMTRVANRFRGCLTLLLLGSAALFCLLASRSAPAFVGTQQPARRRTCRAGLRALGLFFATQTGNTETVAGMIGEASGAEATDIGEVETEDLASYDGLIVGCPTWNTGADDILEDIKGMDLAGKPVAIFGCGDSASYGDNFCDGIEELHDTFSAVGAKMVGYVDSSGYSHTESKSEKDGKFLGLPLDQDNEDDQSEERVANWISQLKGEGMPI